jgi:hypothetical protein
VCPASLDGPIGNAQSSWPRKFNFVRCEGFDSQGAVTLPVTDGDVHVAFGIQTVNGGSSGPFDVTIGYAAEDAFVLVIPPVASARAVVSFVPQTRSVGAQPYAMPSFGEASAYALRIDQQHRPIKRATKCDFGSEIGCVGPVIVKQPVTVTMSGRSTASARLAVYLSWA